MHRAAISRREFFKTSGLAEGLLGLSLDPVEAKAQEFSLRYAKETTTLSTIGNPGMLDGNVRRIWARRHHPKWYKEVGGE
ncbi:MAG: hypothetical protein AABZ68_01060 [Candidatus Deferrimicrobiota bacterium]